MARTEVRDFDLYDRRLSNYGWECIIMVKEPVQAIEEIEVIVTILKLNPFRNL